jgi:hypothetical protein
MGAAKTLGDEPTQVISPSCGYRIADWHVSLLAQSL